MSTQYGPQLNRQTPNAVRPIDTALVAELRAAHAVDVATGRAAQDPADHSIGLHVRLGEPFCAACLPTVQWAQIAGYLRAAG